MSDEIIQIDLDDLLASNGGEEEFMFSLAGQLLLRPRQVAEALGISVSSFYELLKHPDAGFPRPVEIMPGGRAVGFVADEVEEWVASRPRVEEVS